MSSHRADWWEGPRTVPLHERDWAWRNRLRALPLIGPSYRALVGAVGLMVVCLGLLLVPFPGPGWAIVFSGVLIWATEFEPASRLLHWGRARLAAWGRWFGRQEWGVRLGVLAVTFGAATAIVWCVAFLCGQPPGLPASWAALLERWGRVPTEPIWRR